MNRHSGTTVVQRGSFFSAFAYGLFGMLTALIVCAAGVGIYALNVVDRRVDTALTTSTGLLKSLPEILPEIREALPPALADTLADVRDPNYRSQLTVDTHLASIGRDDTREVVINVQNNGDKTVSLMALRIVLLDANNTPVHSLVTYAATPLTVDQEWRGPILPGSMRRCGMYVYRCSPDLTPQIEITDVRTWTGDGQTALTVKPDSVSEETRLATREGRSD